MDGGGRGSSRSSGLKYQTTRPADQKECHARPTYTRQSTNPQLELLVLAETLDGAALAGPPRTEWGASACPRTRHRPPTPLSPVNVCGAGCTCWVEPLCQFSPPHRTNQQLIANVWNSRLLTGLGLSLLLQPKGSALTPSM